MKFRSNLKEQIKKWNKENPELKQKNLTSIAKELNISSQSLSQIDKAGYEKQFNAHSSVIFISKDKEKQKEVWNAYKDLDVPLIKRLEAIRKILDCEIYDLIKKPPSKAV